MYDPSKTKKYHELFLKIKIKNLSYIKNCRKPKQL